jgi:hypothetical protein
MIIFAFFAGALLLLRILVSVLRRFVFRSDGSRDIFFRSVLALAVATIASAFGRRHGSSPQFGDAFLRYLIPAAVSFGYDIALAGKKLRRGTP